MRNKQEKIESEKQDEKEYQPEGIFVGHYGRTGSNKTDTADFACREYSNIPATQYWQNRDIGKPRLFWRNAYQRRIPDPVCN